MYSILQKNTDSVLQQQTSMDLSQHIIPINTDFCVLECKQAFDGLTSEEKKYAHYISRASWYGGLIVLHQVCLYSHQYSPSVIAVDMYFHKMHIMKRPQYLCNGK